jgi:serine/threonine protein kinase
VKSDVYSFGVVLLEIITGRPPIIVGPEGGNLTQWVHQMLFEKGDRERIADRKMQGKHDINSVWKVTNLACRCTERTSSRRPTMSTVVSELKESLDLQMLSEKTHRGSSDNSTNDVNEDSALEMAYLRGVPASGPSVR